MTKKKALILFLVVSAVLLIVALASAAPSRCLFPDQVARAKLVTSSSPADAYCAMNVCRTIGKTATKTWPCDADPSCITGGFGWQSWRVVDGPWAGLPACPAWTNTATWQ